MPDQRVPRGSRKDRFDTVLSSLLTLAALAIAASIVHREFNAGQRAADGASPVELEFFEGWERWTSEGVWTGTPDAEVVLVEFLDFQCVGCKIFHERVLKPALAGSMNSVAFVVIHFPLRTHSHSVPAAVASECAAAQGRFSQFVDAVFASQELIGEREWSAFAEQAGVPDAAAFTECMGTEWARDRVTRGRAIGDSLGIRGTPTLLVNGQVHDIFTGPDELNRAIDQARPDP